MINLNNFLYFYRFRTWQRKIGWWRWMGYLTLGYFLAGRFSLLLLLNLAIIIGLFMFTWSINDYYDFFVEGEDNFLGRKIKEGNLTKKSAIVLCILPLLPALSLLFFISRNSSIFALLFLFLAGAHSIPPIRFKGNIPQGLIFISSPVWATLIFLEGYSVSGALNLNIWMMAIIVFLFHSYMEIFHGVGYCIRKVEGINEHCPSVYWLFMVERKQEVEKRLKILKMFPIIPLIFSLFFSIFNRIFLISAVFSIIRFLALKEIKTITDYQAFRMKLLSPVWSLPEFGIYCLLGAYGGL